MRYTEVDNLLVIFDFSFFLRKRLIQILYIFCTLTVVSVHAQTLTPVVIDFSAHDESLVSVISRLADKSQVNFSYNAADTVLNNKVTFSVKGKSIKQILTDILSQYDRTFKQIGNLIVIYKPDMKNKQRGYRTLSGIQKLLTPPTQKNTVKQLLSNKFSDTIFSTSIRVDTLFLVDTLILHDTLLRYDTTRLVDTVYLKNQKSKISKIGNFPVDYFQMTQNHDSAWSATVYYSPFLTNLSLAGEQKKISIRNFLFGASANKQTKKWEFSLALQVLNFANRFNYNNTQISGGFYLTDTIDAYYTVAKNDTNWYYVTDSTWQPLESYKNSIEKTNQIGYLEMNVAVAYSFFRNKQFSFYLKAGAGVSTLIYRKGMAFVGNKPLQGVDFKEIAFANPIWSSVLGSGMKYRLNSNLDLNAELLYVNYFNSILKNYQYKNKPKAFDFKVGLIFYF